jgi:hypothetical protein
MDAPLAALVPHDFAVEAVAFHRAPPAGDDQVL